MQKKFLIKNPLAIASAVVIGAALAVGMSVWATSIGTAVTVSGVLTVDGASTLTGAVTASNDISVTSGVRVGADATPGHLTALADDSLFVEGQAEYDGIVWFDGSLRASSTLLVTGVATFYSDVTLANATSTNFAITTFATTSALRVSNDAVIQGNITLGTDSADTLTVNAYTTLTNATSTNFAVTSSASTSQLTVSNGFFQTDFADCQATTNSVVYTLSTGQFGCDTDAPGEGRDWGVTVAQDSIRPTTTVGIIVNYASSTIVGLNLTYSTTSLATTTTLNVSQAASTSALRVSNASTLQGDVTIGQSSSQTLTVNAYATLTQATSTTFAATSHASTSGLTVSNNATVGGTLGVTGATTFTGTAKMGANGTALTQVLSGFVDCGLIIAAQSIAATSTGTVGCTTGLSNVNANDAVFLTATTTDIISGGSIVYTGKASTTAANRVQAEIMNFTGAAWTVTTSTWRYLIIR